MAACTNNGGSRARRAVTAALVGVLSVGTVPMAALAEGVNDGISTLALDAQTAFSQGKMTEARDSQNKRLDIPSDGIVTVEAGNYVIPTEVTPKDADPVEVIDYVAANKDEDIQNAEIYYTNPAGTTKGHNAALEAGNFFDAAGTYTVEVKMTKGEYANSSFKTTFIVAESEDDLSNATLFDKANGVEDTTFTYTGAPQQIGVAVNGKDCTSSCWLEIYKKLDAKGNPVTDGTNYNGNVVDAGTYVANVCEGASLKTKITFKVNQVNLSTAKVSVSDILKSDTATVGGAVETVNVDGQPFTTSSGAVSTVAEVTPGQIGKASVIVTPGLGAGDNIIGSATVEFSVVEDLVDDVSYNGSPVVAGTTSNTVNINIADGESFKPERIEVFDNANAKLNPSYYTVTYTDANGNEVDASALSEPGVYTATVRVNAEASHYVYGSNDLSFDINVQSAQIDSLSDIVFKFDGKVGDYFDPTFDGSDMLERLETVVHTKWGDDLAEGTDYEVKAYDADGNEVEQVVDAGKYTVRIELKGNYTLSNGDPITEAELACTIDVQPLDLTYGLYVNGGDLTTYTWNDGFGWWSNYKTMWYVSYTGEDITPSFEFGYYTDADGNVAEYDPAIASKLTWNALPADAVEVTGYRFEGKPVDALNAKGEYGVEFALNSDNYTVTGKSTSNVITVSDKAVAFSDVSADAWYAQGVFQAKQLGYVKGVSGTSIYAPEASISRADALIIISRMAGFDQSVNAEDYLAENGGYVTRYSDVDAGAYYAKAVAWATKVGIVNGYGDGTFGPNDPITREQFAGMLANYAKAMGKDVSVDADAVLAEFPDASSVSGWARGAVAWAASNGVMGNGGALDASSDITRAEVACMAVNYQPEGASTDVMIASRIVV